MKRPLLFAFLLLSGLAGAQVINFPDANLKNKLLAGPSWLSTGWDQNDQAVQIDANNDGEIDMAEAALIYKLNISGANISDLTGLDAFVNLTLIQCGNNQITSFDATMFPNLKTLWCMLNNLSTLDVTSLQHLEVLYCESNQITSLNVAGLSNLKFIQCDYNLMSSVNLNGLTALESFTTWGTPFTSLNFEDSPLLKELRVSDTQLTELDLSNNPQIVYIGCSDNPFLESINLHNGTSLLNSLECAFTNNPNLTFMCVDEGEDAIIADCTWDGPLPAMSTVCTMGTGDFIADAVSVYPNPTEGRVTIAAAEMINSVELYDMQGRLISNTVANEIDLSARQAGVYLLKVKTQSGIKTERLIKK